MSGSPIDRLVRELTRLPGIGEKTATRLAYFILKGPDDYARALAAAILNLKERMGLCSVCFNLTDVDPCRICSDPERDPSVLCVVEEPSDVGAVERTGEFRGRYHVLHGVLSPLDGVAPDDLKIEDLLRRVRAGGVKEVILATNPTTEGEATAVYLADLLKPEGVRVPRIARGMAVGSELEYSDALTLRLALGGRREM